MEVLNLKAFELLLDRTQAFSLWRSIHLVWHIPLKGMNPEHGELFVEAVLLIGSYISCL